MAFEHYWTPSLRTSCGGLATWMSATLINAKAHDGASRLACCGAAAWHWRVVGSLAATRLLDVARLLRAPCGTRLQNLDIGVEVAYTKIDSGVLWPRRLLTAAQNGLAAGPYNVEDQSYWSAAFRAQRNFWP